MINEHDFCIYRHADNHFTFLGRVPLELCEERFSKHYGAAIIAPKVYEGYDEALGAAQPFERCGFKPRSGFDT